MSGSSAWESFLQEEFPGYILAASEDHPFSDEAAARFLESLTGRPQELELLKAVSFLSPRLDELEIFATRELPALCRALPSRTEVERREWEGGFQGRLDLQGTLAHELAGRVTRFVTRSRSRSFALPENVLVRATVERLLEIMGGLRAAGISLEKGWSSRLGVVEGALRHVAVATQLRSVPLEPITPAHAQASQASREPAHRRALEWWQRMREELDEDDPARNAQLVARGALRPLEASTRFELAVGLRLIQALQAEVDRVEPDRWRLVRLLVQASRTELAVLERRDGARVRIVYNQAVFDSGTIEKAFRHYLGHQGRMRPDLAVILEGPERDHRSGVVLEVKLSEDPSYLLQGFREALVYRWEYADRLRAWPRAILVTSSDLAGDAREEDDVVAIDWRRWVPSTVVQGILAPLLGARADADSSVA